MPKHLTAIEKVATLPDVSGYLHGYPVHNAADGIIYTANLEAATPGWDPAGSAGSAGPVALDDLSDVSTTGAVDGDGLILTAGVWGPGAVGGGGGDSAVAVAAEPNFLPARVMRGELIDAVNLDGMGGPMSQGPVVQGNYAFVPHWVSPNGWISVIDLFDKAAPVLVSTATGIQPADIDVIDNLLLVADFSANLLRVMDCSNLGALAQIGSVAITGPRAVHIHNNGYVYVGAGDTLGVSVVDISNPTAPVVVGSAVGVAADNVFGLDSEGSSLYIRGNFNFAVMNVSNPVNPVMQGEVNVSDGISDMAKARGVNKCVLTRTSADRVWIVDVSNPSAPVLGAPLTDATLLNFVLGVVARGNLAYTAGSYICTLDISGTTPSILRTTQRAGGKVDYLAAQDDVLYVGCISADAFSIWL